ncbi:MAG: TIGR04282 family arsenosugar biosynthesis glycosyltransferase [Thermodesulfobacteriota bacterium]
MRKALIIAAKAPHPGRTKTRLSPPLSEKDAASLYDCFLRDIWERISLIDEIDKFIAYYPVSSKSYFSALPVDDLFLFPQKGRGLGDRMAESFEMLFARGYGAVSLIGSDSPTLPDNFIRQSFEALERPDIDLTLGPSRDGGYYLIGLKRLYRQLFDGMEWSTSSVLDNTIKKAEKVGLGSLLLPKWYDIDEEKDLKVLREELFKKKADIAPRTRGFLLSHSGI